MKKGIHYWALPQSLSLVEKLKLAKRAGFEGVGLTILEQGTLRMDCSKQELHTIKAAFEDEGLELVDVASTLNWRCSLTSREKTIRTLAKDRLKAQIEIAAELGTDTVLAVSGFVGMDRSPLVPSAQTAEGYDPTSEIVPYELAYMRSLEAFQELGPFAAQHGIQIGIENIWNKFLLSPLEMKRFIDEIASPSVKVYFDIGNVMPGGYPEQWIAILGSRIVRVHFKDYSLQGGFVNLLEGDIDFFKVMDALRGIGYNGWATVEATACRQFPEYTAYACSDAMDCILC